jgi:hypothetical protein
MRRRCVAPYPRPIFLPLPLTPLLLSRNLDDDDGDDDEDEEEKKKGNDEREDGPMLL